MDLKKKGIFSPCESLDSASMVKCLQALLVDYPNIKFISVNIDKKHLGFRIFFTDPEDSVELEKCLLTFEEQPIWIYPLTAHLIIFGLNHKKSPLFERDLRDAINKKFGAVLKIEKNGIFDQSWLIEIDMPEFKGLEVFQHNNFSSMKLNLPSRNEEVTLKFWCRKCESSGHFQHECRAKENDTGSKMKAEEENDASSKIKSEENNSSTEKIGKSCTENNSTSSVQNSEKTSENFELETTERYAERIGREEALWFSKEKEKNMQNKTSANAEENRENILRIKDIKKEIDEISQSIHAKEDKSLGGQKYKLPEFDSFKDMTKEKPSVSDKTRDSLSGDDDDEIEYICSMDNPVNKSPTSSSSARAEVGNYEEESRSSPETRRPNYSFPVIPGLSHESPSTALKTPKGAEVTTALSERLQECINEVCNSIGVLDRKKLDAFLIHVKKKSNPIRVALNYTANTRGLKEQLQGILNMYYNTPQTGTKEDIQFIKWLNGLVDRYDGSIPKKRKRSGKSGEEPSAKR